MQAYSDPSRENDPHALPDVEIFYATGVDAILSREAFGGGFPEGDAASLEGWYWWPCFPGCLPDSDPSGPFATEAEALADAQAQD